MGNNIKFYNIEISNETLLSAKSALISTGLIVGFTLLTVIGAQLAFPLYFTPVPLTFQSLIVVLSGAFIGLSRGVLSQFLYLVWGFVGLPFFAGGSSGFAVLSDPSAGYLFAFVPGAAVSAILIKRKSNILSVWTGFASALTLILVLGTLHLAVFFTRDLYQAILQGILPFIPGALIKSTIATGVYVAWNNLRKQ